MSEIATTAPMALAFLNLGPAELFFIFVIVLLLFGPKKLPELGKSLGRGLKSFKKGLNEIDSTADEVNVNEDKNTQAQKPIDHKETVSDAQVSSQKAESEKKS